MKNLKYDKDVTNTIKTKLSAYWSRIDLFCKIETIAISVTLLLLLCAICFGKIIPIIISGLQIVGLIISLLIYKDVIKCDKKCVKYIILLVAIIFTVLNISSYSWMKKVDNNSKEVNTPYSSEECMAKEKNDLRNDFSNVGFINITEEAINDLEPDEVDKYGSVESISINGITEFDGNKQFKNNSMVLIRYHSYKCVQVPYSADEVKNMDVNSIIDEFKNAGFMDVTHEEIFDLDPDNTDTEFENQVLIDGQDRFDKSNEISLDSNIKIVTHRPYEKYTLKIGIDFIENIIFSKYDIVLEVGGKTENLSHGTDASFEYRLKKDKYTIVFKNKETESVQGTAEIDLTGDIEVSYKVSCHSDRIDVETVYTENRGELGENEAMIPISSSDCIYENYKDIKKEFKNAGFTNITTEALYDIVWGITEEGEVDEVIIDGETDFKRGDVFAKDALIAIVYHMKEENDPDYKGDSDDTEVTTSDNKNQTSVSYSTNSYKKAKKGKTGVFSYIKEFDSYDIYWIIDFDKGYAYWFCEGNGDITCDRVKIVSGNLNDRVTITWRDGKDEWSWYLHFKYVNAPETLICVDNDGFKSEFEATNLEDALELRDTKEINKY